MPAIFPNIGSLIFRETGCAMSRTDTTGPIHRTARRRERQPGRYLPVVDRARLSSTPRQREHGVMASFDAISELTRRGIRVGCSRGFVPGTGRAV